jgi:hypothetical protein
MKIGSVLSLKEELLPHGELPAALVDSVAAATASSVGRRRIARRIGRFAPQSEVDVALGVAQGRGRGDFRLAATIRARRDPGEAVAARIRRRSANECTIRFVPKIRPRALRPGSWFRKRRRPLEPGLSIGNVAITAGTLGCFVEDADHYYVLSNNHVLADTNRAELGSAVVQPGPDDQKPKLANLVGVLERFEPISFLRRNKVDCALSSIDPDLWFYAGWTEAVPGRLRAPEPLSIDDLGRPVRKAGRTTGVTHGTVTAVDLDRLGVDFADDGEPEKIAYFDDQIECVGDDGRRFSDGGDSGSLIVDERGRARALLFAGGADEDGIELTFANRIETVLAELGVTIVTR